MGTQILLVTLLVANHYLLNKTLPQAPAAIYHTSQGPKTDMTMGPGAKINLSSL